MEEPRQRDEWERTSAIVAMVYNMHRGPKSRYIKPSEFNPYTQPKPLVVSREEAHVVFKQMADAARGRGPRRLPADGQRRKGKRLAVPIVVVSSSLTW